jgi:acyl-CoA reductase-like NAD-dependent aldehyde dehydrogenase
LAAAVFTADRSRAHRVAQGLKAGTVWTNTWGVFDDMFEEGGYKQSGIGRARGTKAMEEFQEMQDPDRNRGAPHSVDSDRSEGVDNAIPPATVNRHRC